MNLQVLGRGCLAFALPQHMVVAAFGKWVQVSYTLDTPVLDRDVQDMNSLCSSFDESQVSGRGCLAFALPQHMVVAAFGKWVQVSYTLC